ncbi:MAG: N-acetylmuramidase family protein [Bacteroidales bacterium]|nr:N-acetylmuramidase family protein [Bacteroidales bacterium]
MLQPRHCAIAIALAATAATAHAADPLDPLEVLPPDSLIAIGEEAPLEIKRLTEEDYIEVARELGVEVAAIKAVVDIEAGKSHQGFWAPGKPLINFDLTMFRKFAQKRGVNLSKFRSSHAVVFSGPNASKYGSRQAGQQARLDAAKLINEKAAIEGTFWGMFQIGGFNWKKCGCVSMDEFVERMSSSEREQLELFAKFIENSGLTKYLKAKNWSAFALRYNGPSYASRGYHTKMASAYRRHGGK